MKNEDLDFSKLNGFDWDNGNTGHIKKHNVDTRECEEVFLNKPFILNNDETHSQIEKRFRVYGQTDQNRRLMLIFTIRKGKIRVISARDQNKKECKEFQEIGGES